ncbi:MAG: hypothetical protein E7H57_05510 [Pantoea sp.]|nr:hypothetical protein [Pantoea sp.]
MKWLPLIPLFFSSPCFSDTSYLKEQRIYNKVTTAISTGNSKVISENEYEDISGYISEGQQRWINLYPKLNKKPFLRVTYFQEGLDISMAYALSENPSEVLKFVNERNVNFICGIPFIEPTQDEIKKYYSKTRAAIMSVNSDTIWKDKCLNTMDKVIASDISSAEE